MSVITAIESIEVLDFEEFCEKFKIISKFNAGDDGTDEELIITELNNIENKNYIVNFIEDRTDGFFRIQRLV